MVADSGLFNPEVFGQGFMWQGQIADDSGWRDNIETGKFENKDTSKGWGRRYKVRIMGIHDKEEESISSDQLPWAQVSYPITAGGGQAGASMTPNLRQGMFVFGYFQDGPEQQVPIITGILGHNAPTVLKQKIGETDSNFAPTSGYAEGKVPKTYRTKEVVPKYDQVTSKPKTKSQEQDAATLDSLAKGALNQFGLKNDVPATIQQLKDIADAQQLSNDLGLNAAASEVFVKSKVHQALRNRIKRANSPISPPSPGATLESADAPHRLNSGQVQREDKYREKIVLSKCHDPVNSSMSAIQTIIDNLANKIDKYQKSIQIDGYIDASSQKNPRIKLDLEIKRSSNEMSKHMRVITTKMMEYVNKTTNVELTSAVSAMPSSMRFMFADMKDLTGQTTQKLYLEIGNGLGDMIGPILSSSLNVNGLLDRAKSKAVDIDLDINLPLPNIDGRLDVNFNNGNVSGFIDANVPFPTRRTVSRERPRGAISGSGTKEDPWISPAIDAQGDIPMPPQETLLPPPPPPQDIPPLSEWIEQFGSNEGRIKFNEAKRGLVTNSLTNTNLSGVGLKIPTKEEFEQQLINNADSDGIAKLSLNTEEKLTTPSVPMCYAEDVVAKIIYANQDLINKANQAVIENMNTFIGDMQSMIGIQQEKTSNLIPGLEPGAIVGITDEEVLDQVRGGTNYITAQRVGVTFFKNIKPGITTSPGSGALVDITVSSGGIVGLGNTTGAQDFTFISRGTNYDGAGGGNGNQNDTHVDTSGIGTGMRLNMVVSGGEIQTIFVHTTGTGYKVGDTIIPHMGSGGSSIAGNGSFKLDVVAGPIDPDGIKIVKNGGNYQTGDVLKVNGGGFDASFTVIASNDVVTPKTKDAAGNKPISIDGLLSKLNGIQGNLSKALNFKNVKANIFPWEEPPNLAVSDYYFLARGGAAQAANQLPSIESVADIVSKKPTVPSPEQALSFVQPSSGQPNINKLLDKAEDTVKNVTDALGTG